jgi:hypothetical protein
MSAKSLVQIANSLVKTDYYREVLALYLDRPAGSQWDKGINMEDQTVITSSTSVLGVDSILYSFLQ